MNGSTKDGRLETRSGSSSLPFEARLINSDAASLEASILRFEDLPGQAAFQRFSKNREKKTEIKEENPFLENLQFIVQLEAFVKLDVVLELIFGNRAVDLRLSGHVDNNEG